VKLLDHFSNKDMLASIAALCYNNSTTVVQTLNSIIQQTYDKIELIIIEDCSKDATAELIKEWLTVHQTKMEIRFIQNEQNKGLLSGVKRFIDMANGQVLLIFSGDDIYEKTRIANVVNAFEKASPEYGFLYSDAKVIDVNSNIISNSYLDHFNLHIPGTDDIYEKLLESNFIPALTLAYRRECILKIKDTIDPNLLFEDYQMTILSSKSHKALFLKTNDVCYRVHGTSIMNTRYMDVFRDKIYFLLCELTLLPKGTTRSNLKKIIRKEMNQFLKFKQGNFTEKDLALAKKAGELGFYFPSFFIRNVNKNRLLTSLLYRSFNFYSKF
jgi:glycosyltransferase involved in cell wall biosynthesis